MQAFFLTLNQRPPDYLALRMSYKLGNGSFPYFRFLQRAQIRGGKGHAILAELRQRIPAATPLRYIDPIRFRYGILSPKLSELSVHWEQGAID